MTECIRELPRLHLDPDAPPGLPPQRVLHAGRKNKTKQTITSTLLIKIQGKNKNQGFTNILAVCKSFKDLHFSNTNRHACIPIPYTVLCVGRSTSCIVITKQSRPRLKVFKGTFIFQP